MSPYSYFSLSSKPSEVIFARNDKKRVFCYPTVVWRPIATQPRRISPWTLYRLKVDSVGYISAASIFFQLFRGGLRKTHDRRRAVRFDLSRSSEVDDFRVIWKGLCDFLLVINSNLSSISHRFWDTTTYRLRIANFPYPTSVQAQIWKCSLCTRSLKFCVRRAKIKFHLAQHMWSASINVTDRQTDRRTSCDGITAPLLNSMER